MEMLYRGLRAAPVVMYNRGYSIGVEPLGDRGEHDAFLDRFLKLRQNTVDAESIGEGQQNSPQPHGGCAIQKMVQALLAVVEIVEQYVQP